jgi:hypothetical protein
MLSAYATFRFHLSEMRIMLQAQTPSAFKVPPLVADTEYRTKHV